MQNLIDKVENLKKQLYDAEKELREYDDGFIYKITSWRYRCYRVHTFHNAWIAEEFIRNSCDGENYMIDGVFSNNPNFKDTICAFREHKWYGEIRRYEKRHYRY